MGILLAILKVMGTVLLIAVCILAALILLLLFAPFRYRVNLRKEDEALEGTVILTWLSRLLWIRAAYAGGEPQITLKILWFTIKQTGKEPSGKGRRRRRSPQTKSRAQEEKSYEEEHTREYHSSESASPGEKKKINASDTGNDFTDRIGKIVEWLTLFPEKFFSFLQEIEQWCEGALDQKDAFFSRVRRRWKQVEPWLQSSALSCYRRLFGRLKVMLVHFRPRRLEGYLRFGTGAPDQTALLFGFLQIILPPDDKNFELEPQLYEAAFSTDLQLRGHIRMNHAAAFLVKELSDKEFRSLFHQFRHRKRTERKT